MFLVLWFANDKGWYTTARSTVPLRHGTAVHVLPGILYRYLLIPSRRFLPYYEARFLLERAKFQANELQVLQQQ